MIKEEMHISFKFFLMILALYAFVFCIKANAEAANYYIDNSKGSDDNAGSFDLPWKTLQKANSTLKAGDTVYLREGVYKNQQISPKNSGEKYKIITYTNYNNEKVNLSSAKIPIYLEKKQYIQVSGLMVTDCIYFFVLYNGSSYNLIQDCTFQNAKAYFGSLMSNYYIDAITGTRDKSITGVSNNYNKIINNKWLDAPDQCSDGPDQNCGTAPSDLHYCEKGAYNLYEGNRFGKCSHDNLVFGGVDTHHNIIRSNHFRNTYRRGLNMYLGTNFNLVEKNSFYDHGLEMAQNPTLESRKHDPWNPGAFQCINGCRNMIVRKNLFNNNGHVLAHNGEYMHFYNNTANRQIITIYSEGGKFDFRYNSYKNNIFSNTISLGWANDREFIFSWLTYVQPGYVMENNIITHNTFTGNNNRWRYNRNYSFSSLAEFEASTQDAFDNNDYMPLFVESSKNNFELTKKSLMIDNGAWLTVIKSPSNKGQSFFIVDDAGYFFDGWGIENEKGDIIKTANGKTTQIKKIDYESNRIYVDPPIDIYINEGLALNYYGLLPDIGAYEFLADPTSRMSPPNKLRVK